jgi:hypothetical protein
MPPKRKAADAPGPAATATSSRPKRQRKETTPPARAHMVEASQRAEKGKLAKQAKEAEAIEAEEDDEGDAVEYPKVILNGAKVVSKDAKKTGKASGEAKEKKEKEEKKGGKATGVKEGANAAEARKAKEEEVVAKLQAVKKATATKKTPAKPVEAPKSKAATKKTIKPKEDPKDEDEDEDSERSYWLMKAEPTVRMEGGKPANAAFSIDDLAAMHPEAEPWDGVRNPVARNNMRSMIKGDLAFFYHSNTKTPGIAGIMEVVGEHEVDGEFLLLLFFYLGCMHG